VIDEFAPAEVKTKPVQQLLDKMDLGLSKVLILVKELDENVALSTRNIPNVIAMPAREANTYTVVSAEYVLIAKDAMSALEEVLA
jgi:large subunit ribosomal protein L4